MRIALVVIGALVLTLAMGTYLRWAKFARPLPPELPHRELVTGVEIELTPTFIPASQPWSGDSQNVFEVRSGDQVLVEEQSSCEPFEPRRYQVEALAEGRQELWCAAYAGPDAALVDPIGAPVKESGTLRGLRVRVGRSGVWWTDQTLWSIGSGAPAGIVRFQIPAAKQSHHGDAENPLKSTPSNLPAEASR